MSSADSAIQTVTKQVSSGISLSGWTLIFSALFIILCFAVIYLIGRIRKQDKKLSRLEIQQQSHLTQDDVYPIVRHYIANPMNRPQLARSLDFLFEADDVVPVPVHVSTQQTQTTEPVQEPVEVKQEPEPEIETEPPQLEEQ